MSGRGFGIVLGLVAAFAAGGEARAQGIVPDSVTVAELLSRYGAEAGMRFGYEEAALPRARVAVGPAALDRGTWPAHARALARLGLLSDETHDGAILLRPVAPATGEYARERLVRLRVVDPAGEPLPGATLTDAEGHGWVADAQGQINVPTDAWSSDLEVRFVGMESHRLGSLAGLPAGGVLRMRVARHQGATATVLARLSPKPLTSIPTASDPGREAARLSLSLDPRDLGGFGYLGVAGATRIDARSAAPALRGSLPTETLLTLDGLPVYHADHYFGLFPAIDPQAVGQAELHRSHYPADWGGSTGGLLALRSREVYNTTVATELNPLAGSALARVKAGAWHLLADGRTTWGDIARGELLESAAVDLERAAQSTSALVRPRFRFADGYVRAAYAPAGSPWRASVQTFGSRDRYDFEFNQSQLLGGERGMPPVDVAGRYEELTTWTNAGARVELTYALSPRLSLGLAGHRSRYAQTFDADGETRIQTLRGERLRSILENELRNDVADEQVALSIGKTRAASAEPTPKHRWRAGLQVQRLATEASFAINQQLPLDEADERAWVHAFTQQEWTRGAWSVNAGLRLSQRLDTAQLWWSPRVKLAYRLGRGSLTAGYSLTQQALRALQHENQFGQTYTLLVTDAGTTVDGTATNYTLGYSLARAGMYLAIEAYHRRLGGTLAALSQQVALPQGGELVNLQPNFISVVGEGEVRGVDLDLRYGRGDWAAQLGYTLARSRRRFDEVAAGAWQRAPDDRRHRLATGLEYGPGRWTFAANLEWATGLSYVDLNVLSAEAGPRRTADPEAFLLSLPAYARVDLGAHYRFRLAGARVRTGLRLYNALDRDNVTQRQYVVGIGGPSSRRAVAVGTDVALLGRLPLAELRVEF